MKIKIKLVKKFNDDRIGEFDPLTKQINILSSLPEKKFREVLAHEMCHYFLDKKFKGQKGPRKEEAICDAMEAFGKYLKHFVIRKNK